MIFEGEKVMLRYVQADDADHLLKWENDPEVWDAGEHRQIYSRQDIEEFIHAHQDIFLQKQLRFMVCKKDDHERIGCVDLFQFSPEHQRAGIGILIYDKAHRRKGYAREAIQLVMAYGRDYLRLHQLFCNVLTDNKASLIMFQHLGFKEIGTKIDWHFTETGWKDELFMQCILTDDGR